MTTLPDEVPVAHLTDGSVALRPLRPSDVDAIAAACQDGRLQRYIPVPRPYRRIDAEEYVARSTRLRALGRKHVFAVVDPTDEAGLLGVISLTVAGRCGNAAYWVVPTARGAGVARRALRVLADWAFDHLELAVILLEIHDTNAASAAVAEAAGFHRSGTVEVPAAAGAECDGPPGSRRADLYSRLASDRPG